MNLPDNLYFHAVVVGSGKHAGKVGRVFDQRGDMLAISSSLLPILVTRDEIARLACEACMETGLANAGEDGVSSRCRCPKGQALPDKRGGR